MKIFLKILAAIIVILVALIFILPIVFKGEIIELTKKEINRNVNATIDFSDMDLSLIRNFPNFSLNIEGLTVVGKGDFSADTLANIKAVNVVIDLFSVINGETYEVKKIIVDSPKLLVKIAKTGQANYDIALPEEEKTPQPETGETSAFNLRLKYFQIVNATVVYEDNESDLHFHIQGLNSSLLGDFSQDLTNLKTNIEIGSLTARSGGIEYLSKASLKYKASVEADLKNSIYTLGKNELTLNDLQLAFNGSVSILEEGINLVLTFKAPDNSFKSLLSLVPAVYAKDFESITADGKLTVDGSVKGIYNENRLPAFDINVLVDNGMFAYPDLPKSVTGINIISKISNKGGDADNTIIDVSQFSMNLGTNPFIASLLVKTPVSDPDVNARVKGTLDLSTLKDFYPVEDELSGTFIADITVKGKLSSIEKEQYDKFVALGSVLIQNLNYNSTALNKPVEIASAQLNFSPQYLDLVSFKMNVGKSDLSANGKVMNYLAYVFKDGDLKGKLTIKSKYFNIDDLLAEEKAEKENMETESEEKVSEGSPESSVIEIPGKIDFAMNASFDELIYDGINMKAVKGKVSIKNKVLKLDKLQMDVVKGLMTVSGSYSTVDLAKPKVDLKFNLKALDIPSAYNQFAVMRTYLPIAKKASGKFSASFNLKTNLDQQMMPVYETMNGAGQLNTSKITINGLNTLLQIAEALNISQLKNLELDKLFVKFQFINGKMAVKPFDIKYKNITANIEGWTSFDQSIGYVMGLDIPRAELGTNANQLMEDLMKKANALGGNFELPDNISFDILIGGTLSKPTIKTGLAESGNDLIKKAKEEVIRQISEEAKAQARKIIAEADKQAKALIAEAEKQANYLRLNADEAIKQLNAETDKQVAALMTEAKKQGFVSELAAQEVIKQLRKEADSQIGKLENDADKHADALVNTAKKTAAGLKKEAQKQADALLTP